MVSRTDTTLPAGHTARAPRLDDAGAITRLVQAYTRAVVGFADYTEDEVRDDLTGPDVDLDRDARLVFHGDDLTGYATAVGKPGSDRVEIDVVAPDPRVSASLFAWALARAADRGPRVTVDHGVYRADAALRDRTAAHGFAVATTFHRMRIDHEGHVPAPATPPGVTLTQGTDPAVRAAAHAVHEGAFVEHFGYVPESFEDWHEKLTRRSVFDWPMLWVASLDGEPAGLLLCTDQFADDEQCGYVDTLGVLPAARGRGIAKFLLRHAFALDAAAGRAGTVLHVDSNNTTPALGVYESVGMRSVLVVDIWRRVLATA
jgi:ribosomal protein S18 acetylase RimI-like enzyme